MNGILLLFIFNIVIAIWILVDSIRRESSGILYALGTCVFGILIAPIYMAKRNLKRGEIREGGAGWNIVKNFTLLWTLLMSVTATTGFINVLIQFQGFRSDAEMTGFGLGVIFGLGIYLTIWFVITISAVMIGFLIKDTSIVEKGPTGELIEEEYK